MEMKDWKNDNYYTPNNGVNGKQNVEFKHKNYQKKNKKKENFVNNNNPDEFYQNRDFKYKNDYGNNTMVKHQNHQNKMNSNFQKMKSNPEVNNLNNNPPHNIEKEAQINMVINNSNNVNSINTNTFVNQQPVNHQRMPFVANNQNATNNFNNNGYFPKNKKMNYKNFNQSGNLDYPKQSINYSGNNNFNAFSGNTNQINNSNFPMQFSTNNFNNYLNFQNFNVINNNPNIKFPNYQNVPNQNSMVSPNFSPNNNSETLNIQLVEKPDEIDEKDDTMGTTHNSEEIENSSQTSSNNQSKFTNDTQLTLNENFQGSNFNNNNTGGFINFPQNNYNKTMIFQQQGHYPQNPNQNYIFLMEQNNMMLPQNFSNLQSFPDTSMYEGINKNPYNSNIFKPNNNYNQKHFYKNNKNNFHNNNLPQNHNNNNYNNMNYFQKQQPNFHSNINNSQINPPNFNNSNMQMINNNQIIPNSQQSQSNSPNVVNQNINKNGQNGKGNIIQNSHNGSKHKNVVKSEKNLSNFVDPNSFKENVIRKQTEGKVNNDIPLMEGNNFNKMNNNKMNNTNFNLANHGNSMNLNNNPNIANIQQCNYSEDPLILNNRKHSETNLINVNPAINDPSYRLKVYKSQNKFNLGTNSNEPYIQRNDQPKHPSANIILPNNHNINYQKFFNNHHNKGSEGNDKNKYYLNSNNKEKSASIDNNINISNFNLENDNHSLMNITIKLKEGMSKVIEIKKNDNINTLVKSFCENYNLGEMLIKPITNKILQSLDFMNNLSKSIVPNHFEELLREAFDFYSIPEKWESIIGEDFVNPKGNYDYPQEKKRNKSA